MTHDPAPFDDRPDRAPTGPVADDPIDDLTLAGLVRDVADGWRMPPQRLDQPSWRDRVEPVGHGRHRGRLGRLVAAATLAIVATATLSLVAIWLTLPPGQRSRIGASSSPSATTATPRITDRPTDSPLPRLALNGPLPTATSVLVRAGAGYAVADLTTGLLGPQIADDLGSGAIERLADGSMVCLCVATDGYASGAYTHALVILRRLDASGAQTSALTVGDYSGIPDPRTSIPTDIPPHVDIVVSFSPDGLLGFVGWTARKPPVWQAGVVVVDVVAGRVVQRIALPDLSTGPDDAMREAFGPRLVLSPDGTEALLSRSSYWVDRGSVVYHSVSDHYRMSLGGSRLGDPGPFAPNAGCSDGEADAGLSAWGAWFLCYTNGGSGFVVRRIGPDGTVLGDSQVNGDAEGGTWLRTGPVLYFWAPLTRTVTSVDLYSGALTSGSAPAPAALAPGPLELLGRWLAPSAMAKVFLQPGLVVSPDGTRLYALGLAPSAGGPAGSTGVFAFDLATLKPLGRWAPTADLVSIAISADGRFVYAAGSAGVDATGAASPFGSSIAVYDTRDGSVRLLAGRLGTDPLSFVTPVLP